VDEANSSWFSVEGFDLQLTGALAVREEGAAFLVVRAEDPDDWLARFEKSPDFPAREWAENMVSVYNRRLSKRPAGPPTPPGTRPGSYHPG
jgi:hypothetical protein